MKKPNILFIMSDQMRHDALGCNGNSIVKTPNYDRLAAMGINFSDSYTPGPACIPARASITTGFYAGKCTGQKDNDGVIKEGFPFLGDELNKRGYETYTMGKLHYLYAPPGKKRITYGINTVEFAESGRIIEEFDPEGKMRGLEEYHDYLHSVGWGGYTRGDGMGNNDVYPATSPIPEEHYVDAWVADRAIYHMEKHLNEKPDKPFFMWASFPKPHSAFNPPRPYDSMYDPRLMPDPVGDISLMKDRGFDREYQRHFENYWDKLSPECKKVIKAHYYGLISFQDKQVGKLLDFLDRKNLAEDTIIVYTADHGEMLGDLGLYYKGNFYNGSVKVPLVISYPRMLKGGQTSNELAGLQDILPTLMSMIGEPLEQPTDGTDLTEVISGTKSGREYYVSQFLDDPGQEYMITSRQWKYIYRQTNGSEELYDKVNDPYDLNNLAGSEDSEIIAVKNKLNEQLTKWCIENDEGMIENGKLKMTPGSKESILPKRTQTFGRRFY